MTNIILSIPPQPLQYKKMSFELVKNLISDHEYTIKIYSYNPNGDCEDINTFKAKYRGWRIRGIEDMLIDEEWRILGLWSTLSTKVTLRAEKYVPQALERNIIGFHTINLVFYDLRQGAEFDLQKNKFIQPKTKIVPFETRQVESTDGKAVYETSTTLNYLINKCRYKKIEILH